MTSGVTPCLASLVNHDCDDEDDCDDDDDDCNDDDGDDIHEQVMTIAGKYFALYRSRGLSEGKRKESLFIPRHPTMAL